MEITLLALGLTILAAFALWLLSTVAQTKRWVLFIAVPTVILAATSTMYTMKSIMGRPLDKHPDQVVFLDYYPVGKTLYVWYLDISAKQPRTSAMPYSEKMHEQLEDAKQRRQAGQTVVMGKKSKGKEKDTGTSEGGDKGGEGTNDGGDSEGEYTFYNFNHEATGSLKPK